MVDNEGMTIKRFTVTIRFASPAWDEKSGISYTVPAMTKREASARVRRMAYNDGHTVGRRYTMRAIEIE